MPTAMSLVGGVLILSAVVVEAVFAVKGRKVT
jgi:hypothetical protein